ncbi:ABC transporter permease [Eggerthellaceae bacterium zg-997]|nr:ABC transporter permease [Eggerthellaceae bacterium zg-997]
MFAICLIVSSSLLITTSISSATSSAASQLQSRTGAGFTLGNNIGQGNFGTPRGAGTVTKGDIDKIASHPAVESYTARQMSFADPLNGISNVKLTNERHGYSEKNEKRFGNSVSLEGLNASKHYYAFRSEALRLTDGRHIVDGDHHVAIVHETFAKQNNLKVGDTFSLKRNPYDPDNRLKSEAEVTVTVVGITSGTNPGRVSSREELVGNVLLTDLDTTRDLNGFTSETEYYHDAGYQLKPGESLEKVLKDVADMGINWRTYTITKNANLFAGINGAISSMRDVVGTALVLTVGFSVAVLALVLFLWMNERRRETGVLLAVGVSHPRILAQHFTELMLCALPACALSYPVAQAMAQGIGNVLLGQANASAARMVASAGQLGGGLETAQAARSLESLAVQVDPAALALAGALMLGVVAISVAVAAVPIMRTRPRNLLGTHV